MPLFILAFAAATVLSNVGLTVAFGQTFEAPPPLNSAMSIAAVGGGAAPFSPFGLDMNFLHNQLLDSCVRQMKRMKKSRDLSFFSYNTGTNRLGKLYCRTGFTLQIHEDGRINGTRKPDAQFGVLEFLSVAFGLVSIKGRESNRYLCMNKKGQLYGAQKLTAECVFMEKMLENWFNTYTSCKYSQRRRKWFLALNRRGKPRRGSKSRRKQKFTQFLVLHLADQLHPEDSYDFRSSFDSTSLSAEDRMRLKPPEAFVSLGSRVGANNKFTSPFGFATFQKNWWASHRTQFAASRLDFNDLPNSAQQNRRRLSEAKKPASKAANKSS